MKKQAIGREDANVKPCEGGDESLIAPPEKKGTWDSDHLLHRRCVNIARSWRITSAMSARQSPFGYTNELPDCSSWVYGGDPFLVHCEAHLFLRVPYCYIF